MSSTVLAPSFGIPAAPARPTPHPARYLGIGVLVIVGFVVALSTDDPALRILMAALSIGVVGIVVTSRLYDAAVRSGEVRIADGGSLRFVPPRRIWAAFLATTTLLIAASIPMLLSGDDSPGLARWSPFALLLAGTVFLGWLLVGLRLPVGLALTEHGLRGVRGTRRVDRAWSELAHTEVSGRTHPLLVLHWRDDTSTSIDPRWLGSDPQLVAAAIRHFAATPADRELLSDGPAALARVEDAVG